MGPSPQQRHRLIRKSPTTCSPFREEGLQPHEKCYTDDTGLGLAGPSPQTEGSTPGTTAQGGVLWLCDGGRRSPSSQSGNTYQSKQSQQTYAYQGKCYGIRKFLIRRFLFRKYCGRLEPIASLTDGITLSYVIQDTAGAAGTIRLVPSNMSTLIFVHTHLLRTAYYYPDPDPEKRVGVIKASSLYQRVPSDMYHSSVVYRYWFEAWGL